MANETKIERPPVPEVPKTPEQQTGPEAQRVPAPENELPTPPEHVQVTPSFSDAPRQAPVASVPVDPVLQQIESILSEGLQDQYATLDPITKEEFKVRGEITAREVASLLSQAKVQVRKVLQLIISWLKILPGVSKLFLEQDAKIKTDRLLAMRRKMLKEE